MASCSLSTGVLCYCMGQQHVTSSTKLTAESRLHMYMCWRGSQLDQVCRTCSKGCSDSSSCHAQGWGVQCWCSSIFPALDLY